MGTSVVCQKNQAAPGITILDAMRDPLLFGPWFKDGTWDSWMVFLSALFGLPLEKGKAAIFRRQTGRQTAPRKPAREGWVIAGRRAGKSLIAALVAVFMACFRDYRKHLGPGERATVMVIAADRRQARVVFRYITGLMERIPMLVGMVESQTRETINLKNRVTLEVHTANFRAVRGYTVAAAICDEVAFWRSDESANPDAEILNGLRPGMATIPGAMLLCISSPYARRGVLWEAYRQHYGQENDAVLVWQADTRSMNPTVEERFIAEAYEQDEVVASAEYGAEFRRDIESFLLREAVEAVTVPERRELPPVSGLSYEAYCDPSGGSQDSMTLAIAHHEKGRAVLDALRERRPPFSPEDVVREFAALLKAYRVSRVRGDRYAGEWPRERFQAQGIRYEVASMVKSDLYLGFLPMINSRQAELLDHPRLLAQLCGLERKTARGGRDTIDHWPGGHDDLANAAAGELVEAARERTRLSISCFGEPRRFDPLGNPVSGDGSWHIDWSPGNW
ncbi:MAG: hypothetical protein IH846_18170 [Acidobacteria bacterium]|nr:hypothetical protein [Acidobacteriota bacterium]